MRQSPHTHVAASEARLHGRAARLWLLCFLAAAILLGAIRVRRHAPTAALRPPAGRAPLFVGPFPQLGGDPWVLADHRGNVILINYWATWCEPCRQEMPALAQLSRELSPRGLAVVGVSLDTGPDAPDRVRRFAAQFHLPYPVAFPPTASTLDSGPAVLPTTLLVDREGRLAKTVSGPIDRHDIAGDVAALLAEP